MINTELNLNKTLINLINDINKDSDVHKYLFPRIENKLPRPDMIKQSSDYTYFDHEYVWQDGSDDCYYGEIALKLDDDLYFVFEFRG